MILKLDGNEIDEEGITRTGGDDPFAYINLPPYVQVLPAQAGMILPE